MGSLLLWAALNATTTPHRRLTNRPTRTAPLGPAPKAIVLFMVGALLMVGAWRRVLYVEDTIDPNAREAAGLRELYGFSLLAGDAEEAAVAPPAAVMAPPPRAGLEPPIVAAEPTIAVV